MFLRSTRRWKDGKEHTYWSIVENRRCRGERIVQQTVLYLGEINDSQRAQWIRAIEVFDEDRGALEQIKLFADERPLPEAAPDGVRVRLRDFELHRPRQWGACWLFTLLWKELGLEEFWRPRLGFSREGTDWEHVLQTLCSYRLLDPGSAWRLHRVGFDHSAMGDLLGEDFALAAKDTLYRCLDRLVEHKRELFSFLAQRWEDLFGAKFDVLLYDLTSTYFESNPPFPEGDKRTFGYSRDKRSDCVQVVIALIVTPRGLPGGLRGSGGQHGGQNHPWGLSAKDRGPIWQSRAHLDHGSGYPHRRSPCRDARLPSAHPLSGRHAQGPPGQTGG